MLTKHQIQDYNKNGFIVIEELLTKDEINKTRSLIDQFIEESREINESDNIFDLEEGHSKDNPRLTRVKQPHLINIHFLNLIKNSLITKVLKDLLGDNILLKSSKLNTKFEKGGSAVEWHQDWAFYPHTNDDVLAVGVMLDDVNLSNGPLMVIPETHKGPILNHNNSDGIFCGAIDPKDKDFNFNDAIPLIGKAGSISIHHARLLHGSAINKSSSRRMMLFYELSAADSWPLVGAPSYMKFTSPNDLWKQMKSQLILGKISTCPRMENIPVRIPLPPPRDHGSIFKIQKTGNSKSAFM